MISDSNSRKRMFKVEEYFKENNFEEKNESEIMNIQRECLKQRNIFKKIIFERSNMKQK